MWNYFVLWRDNAAATLIPTRRTPVPRISVQPSPIPAGRLRDLRRHAGLTQEQIGHAIGRDGRYYGNIERGKSVPALHTLAAIAHTLGVTLAELVSDAPLPSDPSSAALAVRIARLSPRGRRLVEVVLAHLESEPSQIEDY